MTTHETLVKARNLLDERGHVKDIFWSARRGVCVHGAVHWAATGQWQCKGDDPRVAPAIAELKAALGSHQDDLFDWNDAANRTKEEALALFDEAIAATAPEPDTSFLTETKEAVVA